jgi:phage terminase large subunit-like protein
MEATPKRKPGRPRKSPEPAALQEVEAELAGLLDQLAGDESLEAFIRRISPHLAPAPHLEPLIRLIERARHERVRALISMPPRHGKTLSILHGLAWWLKNSPADVCAFFSYGDDLARSKSRTARHLAVSAGVKLASDSANLSEWRTTAGGGLLAGGAGGALTGQGVTGLFVIDDPIKNREEADSAVVRNKIDEWIREVALTRLEGASVLLVQTRWHPDDPSGRLAAAGGWEVLNLQAVAEGADPLGRAPGEALWPERFPIEELDAIRRQIGEWSFAALYQGLPRPRGTAVFGEPSRFDLEAWRPEAARVVIGADPAASEKTSADYSVACVLAVEGRGDRMTGRVLEIWRGQVAIPKFTERLRALSAKWFNCPIAVEAVGGFKAIPQMLRQVDPLLRLVEVAVRGDKFTRAQPVAAAWNDGRILIPTSAPWVEPFLAEVQAFSGVRDRQDDQVDALAHAWNSIVGGRAGSIPLSLHHSGPRPWPTDNWGRRLRISGAL